MTVENCIKLLEAWKKNIDDGINVENAKRSHENMRAHILSSRKFKDHPILKELSGVKEDGKKSKR